MQKHNHWRWSRKATPCRWRLRLHIYFNFAKVIVNCWTWIEFLRDARKEWKMPSKRQKAGLGFAHTSFTLSTASLCCLVVVELNIQFFSTLLCCVWRSPGKLNINNLIKAVNETFFFIIIEFVGNVFVAPPSRFCCGYVTRSRWDFARNFGSFLHNKCLSTRHDRTRSLAWYKECAGRFLDNEAALTSPEYTSSHVQTAKQH